MKKYTVLLTKKEITYLLRQQAFVALVSRPYFFSSAEAEKKYRQQEKETKALMAALEKALA